MMDPSNIPTRPLSVKNESDLKALAPTWASLFTGKEEETNWNGRRLAVVQISRLCHGNAPHDFRAAFSTFIRSNLDNIQKTVDSLRTSVSQAGLSVLEHIAVALGHDADFLPDFVLANLITRCCNTNKVKRDTATHTVEVIVGQVTCNKNLLNHILSAAQHKDPNARGAVPSWLTVLMRDRGRHCGHAQVLDLIEACIRSGLNDSKPQVRTPMRDVYAIYAGIWEDRASRLRESLGGSVQKFLTSAPTAPAKSSQSSIRQFKQAAMLAQQKKVADQIRPAPLTQRGHAGTHHGSYLNTSHHNTASHISQGAVGSTSRPASALSTHSNHQETESHDDSRPRSHHGHNPSGERKFRVGILNNAPIRPQRALTEGRRVPPKHPAVPLHHTISSETKPTVPTFVPETEQAVGGGGGPVEGNVAALAADVGNGLIAPSSEENLDLTKADAQELGPETTSEANVAAPLASVEQAIPRSSPKKHRLLPAAGTVDVALRTTSSSDHLPTSPLAFGGSKEQGAKANNETGYPFEIHQDSPSPVSTKSVFRVREVPSDLLGSTTKKLPSPPGSPTVLREISAVNDSLDPPAVDTNIQDGFLKNEIQDQNQSNQEKDPEKTRKHVMSAIEKIKSRRMDDFGYRKVSSLVKGSSSLFEDENLINELLLALLEVVESPAEARLRAGRPHDNKVQVLHIVREILGHGAKYSAAYHPRALCALVNARGHFETRCHVVGGIEKTAAQVVAVCNPIDAIDGVLDSIELQATEDIRHLTLPFALHLLTMLLRRVTGDITQDAALEKRLTQFALSHLRGDDSQTRRATIVYCVELSRFLKPEDRYFRLLVGGNPELKALLSYFMATTIVR